MNRTTKAICINAVIAAVYVSLTLLLAPIGYGVIQLRIAECFTILPAIMPFTVWGVTVGCLLANLLYPVMGVYDIVFGTLITLVAAYATSKIRNMWLAPLPPVLANGFGLPLIWLATGVEEIYWLNAASILLSQALVLYIVGVPLYLLVKRSIMPLLYKEYDETQSTQTQPVDEYKQDTPPNDDNESNQSQNTANTTQTKNKDK